MHSASITIAKVLPIEPALLSIRGEICFVKVGQLACSYWGKRLGIFTEGPSYDLALCLPLSLESKKSPLLLHSVKYFYKEVQKVTDSYRQSLPDFVNGPSSYCMFSLFDIFSVPFIFQIPHSTTITYPFCKTIRGQNHHTFLLKKNKNYHCRHGWKMSCCHINIEAWLWHWNLFCGIGWFALQ